MTSHDNVTDIVERLRAWEPFVSDGYQVPAAGQVMHEAAALIEAQQADLATLRKQLENAREALIQADLTIRSFKGTDQSDVEFIREALAALGPLPAPPTIE